MKKLTTHTVLFGILFLNSICISQNWEALPINQNIRTFSNCSATHFDNSLFLAAESYNSLKKKQIFILNNNEWKTFHEFDSISPGKSLNIRIKAIGDSGIIIGTSKEINSYKFEEIFYYDGDSIRELSKYSYPNQRASNRYHFGLNDSFLTYFIPSSTGNQDTLTLVKHGSNGIAEITRFIPTEETFLANGFDALFYHGPDPNPSPYSENYYYYNGLVAQLVANIPPLIQLYSCPYNNGFVYGTSDSFFGGVSDPKRKLVKYENGHFQMIGLPEFNLVECITNYKGKLYLSSRNGSIYGPNVIYKFDGIYDTINFEDELFYNVSTDTVSGEFYEITANKDYLYLFGRANLIDSVRPAFGMVRTPILNDVNLAPSALNESYSTNDTTITLLDITANDSDPNGDHLYPKVISHSHGQIRVRTNEQFEYTPEFGFVGNDTIYYESCDVGGMCASAYAVITITQTSEEPFANDDIRVINENETIAIDVAANDLYGSQGIEIKLITPPQKGQVVFDQVSTFTYTPDFNEALMDSFQYEACRSYNWCKTAWARVYINLTNVPPVVEGELAFVDNPQVTIEPLINDYDPDTDLITYEIIQGPFHPSSFLTNLNSSDFRFVTSEMYAFVRDSVLYKVCDPYGACDSAWAVFWGNRPPVTNTDTAYITEYQTHIYPLANDYDPDNQYLVYDILAGPFAPNSEALYCGPGCLRYNNPDINKFWHDSIIYKATDIRGISTEGKIVLINATLSLSENDLGHLSLYPNPTTKELYIKANASLENGLCKIYDAKGKLVHSSNLQGENGQYTIDVSPFDNSYYIIYISTADRVYFGNFIKL